MTLDEKKLKTADGSFRQTTILVVTRLLQGTVGNPFSCQLLLTSVVSGTVDDGVILLLVPPWILLLTGEGCAYFRHLAGVPAAPARVHGAPVQPGTSA